MLFSYETLGVSFKDHTQAPGLVYTFQPFPREDQVDRTKCLTVYSNDFIANEIDRAPLSGKLDDLP